MIESYNLSLTNEFLSNYVPKQLKYKFLEKQNRVIDDLDRITKTCVINANDLEELWFPNIECDIFISHSHKDVKLVNKLAMWIYDVFQLKSFIDATVWGHSEVLMKKINDTYSKNNSGGYDYKKVINVANHVNMILMTAILKVIDSSKCVFFLNTPNSISPVKDSIEQATYSPWIYSEIMFTHIIDKNRKFKGLDSSLSESLKHHDDIDLKMNFKLPTEHLVSINNTTLKHWKITKDTNQDKLAILSQIVKSRGILK